MRTGGRHSGRLAGAIALATALGAATGAGAQDLADRDPLGRLNASVETLVRRVSDSVVQVTATTYGPVASANPSNADSTIGRQRSVGSGVVIDGNGYIITNAHVVANASRVQIVVPGRVLTTAGDAKVERGRTLDATIVGVAPEIDLALLQVRDASLPAIALADYRAVRQGELVFAFGSPQGLRGSVTMGVVSAVARQPVAENPMVYIQTDAPINHGNSGGPLVNVKGELVGINTYLVSGSGGSQGMGFAIPSALVGIAYPKLRQFGHLHRGDVGLQMQTVTPTLAAGLKLAQDCGVMISDVMPGGAADAAGLQPKDVIVTIDGKEVADLPALGFELFTRSAGDTLHLVTLRGTDRRSVDIIVRERRGDLDRLTSAIDPRSLIARLGIYAVPLAGEASALRLAARVTSGVIVVGRAPDDGEFPDTGLAAGDTICAVNDVPVGSLAEVASVLDGVGPDRAVVLQVERDGQFVFLTFELD